MRPLLAALAALLLTAGCAASGQTARPVSPAPREPPASLTQTVGQEQALQLGATYAQSLGYQVRLLTADMREGAWWLHYAAHHRPGELKLRVDAESAAVTRVLDTVRSAAPAP
jgi:hypothetical protein